MKPYETNSLDYKQSSILKKLARARMVLLFIISIILVLLVLTDYIPMYIRIIAGSFLLLTTFLYPLYYSYLGLIYTFLLSFLGIYVVYVQYQTEKQETYILIVIFLLTNTIVSIMIARLVHNERDDKIKYQRLSIIDGLTGIYNHRYFQYRLDEEISRAQRTKSKIAMFMIDLDKFKSYNDRYGHKEGDEVLRRTAIFFKSALRLQDIVFRYGGDEFAVILPETDEETAATVAKRLTETYSEKEVSISVGFSVFPEFAKNRDEIITQADNALYHAKNEGRNNAKMYNDIFQSIKSYVNVNRSNYIDSLRTILSSIASKDRYTYVHSERVSNYAIKIGEALGLNEHQVILLKIEGLLHDIGNVEIPEAILLKRGKLTKDEFNSVMKHTIYSANILISLSDMDNIIPAIKHHHERYDGEGYPDNKIGTEIPLNARILAIADSFDAMLSKRPYREGLTVEHAKNELIKNSGKQFDPELVDIFLEVLDKDALGKNQISEMIEEN